MSSEEQLKIARRAILHVLEAIASDPRKFWLMGDGTESWAQLTKAAEALWGEPVEKIRGHYRPDQVKYARYCKEREEDEKLLRHCLARGITIEEVE